MGGRARGPDGRFLPKGSESGLGSTTGYVGMDASGVTAGMATAQSEFEKGLNRLGGGIATFGNRINSIGNSFALLGAPFLGFVATGIQTAAKFDSAMAEIAARTGLVGEEMEKVRQTALDLGAATAFSAQESADALLMLLAAGLDTTQALETLPVVLTAAAASGEALGVTADKVTTVMAAFGLEADQAGIAVQAMSSAASASQANMGEMGEALQDVGGDARTFGLDVEETSAILAVFATVGKRGSEAGTQLRSIFTALGQTRAKDALKELNVEMYNADGTVRDFNTVLQELNAALSQRTAEDQARLIQDLAGSYGRVGFQALLAANGFSDMQAKMADQADVTDVAAKMMDTFEGSVDSLGGSIQSLQITVIEPFMNGPLKDMIQQATGIINKITEWATKNPELANTILSVGLAVGVLGVGLKGLGMFLGLFAPLLTGFSTLSNLIRATAIAFGLYTPAATAAATSSAAAGAAGTVAAGGFTAAGIAAKLASAGVWLLNAALVVLTSPITLLIIAFTSLGLVIAAWGDDAARAIKMIGQILGVLIREGFERLGRVVPGILNALGKGIRMWVDLMFFPIRSLIDLISEIPNAIKKAGDAIKGISRTGKGRGGLFGSGIGPDFDPIGGIRGRASGGPVQALRPYIVGEQGPELFVPGRSGNIVNNQDMSRMNQRRMVNVAQGAVQVTIQGAGQNAFDIANQVEEILYNFFTEVSNE